jgi:hypothetical protein
MLFSLGLAAIARPVHGATSPVLLDYRFLSPDTLSNGQPRPLVKDDTVVLLTRWEVPGSAGLEDSLRVTADFSRLDPGVPGNRAWPAFPDSAGKGLYRVTYALSHLVSRRDSSGIRIPLLAIGPTGETDDRRIEVCLSNRPPVHVATRVVPPEDGPRDAPYRSGSTLDIETIWRSPDDLLPLEITASFAEVDTLGLVMRGSDRGDGVFLVHYLLPLSRELMLPDGTGKLIPITARDTGCGETTDATLRIDIDTEPPPVDLMRIDPLPTVTTADSLLVGGEAPQSAVVVLVRNKAVQDTVEAAAATGRFSGMLGLLPGENRIQVRGMDAAGNSTLPYPASPGAVIVTRVESAQLEVGTPYSRKDKASESGDDIALRNPEPMDGVVVRIFNLEGYCLWEERPAPCRQFSGLAAGDRRAFCFHWAGTDRADNRAPQGYYLVRAEWRGPGGKARSITKGLLLRD